MHVPDGWEMKKLSEIGEIITGNTPPTDNQEYYNGNIPFIGPSDLGKEKYILKSEKTLTNEGFEQTRKLPKNSILVTCIGELGKIGISKLELATNQQINSLVCNKKFDTEFVYYALSADIKFQMQKEAGLQVVPIVNKSSFSKLNLIIPKEKKEQEKIAKILSTLDKSIEATNRLIEKEKNIKTALMQELLTNGIDKDGHIRTRATHTYKESELGLIPDEWEVKKIENIADIFGGGTPDRSNNDFWENGTIFWATPTDITAIYNSNYIEDTKEKISEKGLSGSSAKLLPIGSILLTSRATIGERKISKIPICTNQGFTSLVPKGDNGIFIYYLLDKYIAYMYSRAYGTTFPEISRTQVKNMPIALPKDENEQKQIAKILTTQDKKIETEETNLAKLKELKKGLMNDLLSGKVRVKV